MKPTPRSQPRSHDALHAEKKRWDNALAHVVKHWLPGYKAHRKGAAQAGAAEHEAHEKNKLLTAEREMGRTAAAHARLAKEKARAEAIDKIIEGPVGPAESEKALSTEGHSVMHSGPLFLTQATGRVGALGYLSAYDYVVATAAALTAIVDNGASALADGTQAAVVGVDHELWILDTNSAGPAGPGVVATFSGVGFWIRVASSAADTDYLTDVIYRPAVVASFGIVMKTWAEVEAANTATVGLLRVWMDPTGGGDPTTVTIPATAATNGRGMMEWHSAVGHRVNVLIAPGGVITSIGMMKDVRVRSDLSGATPLAFASNDILRMENSVIVPALAAGGSMIVIPATFGLQVYLDQDSSLEPSGGGFAIDVATTATLRLTATRGAVVFANAITTVAGSSIIYKRDASVDEIVFTGAGTATETLIDLAANEFYDDAVIGPVIVALPIPGGPSVQQAIDALKPTGGTFVFASLTAGVLTVAHNLGQQYVYLVVADDTDQLIIPDNVLYVSTTTLSFDLSSYGVITGTWKFTIRI